MSILSSGSRFQEKTKNDFYHRDTFTKYSGKYDYVQLDYNPSVGEIDDRIGLIDGSVE